VGHFTLLMLFIVPMLAVLLEVTQRAGFVKTYFAMLVIAGVVAWWLVLAHKSRQVAQEESNRQAHLLMKEIESHRETDRALQAAREAAEIANRAKTRYISAISHELRTPLNSILGYAQLMGEDPGVPPHRKQAVSVIRRGGEHLLSLIEGTLDIARIEGGKLRLDVKPMRFADCVHEMAALFELQAAGKGLAFRFEPKGNLPELVRADEKRVRQIVINLLGNAIKFTSQGQVTFRVRHAREMAWIEIEDTGPGMKREELDQVFEPFARGEHAGPGAGLGLTIAKMLTDLMGGEMLVASTPGQGSTFTLRLFLPELRSEAAAALPPPGARHGYAGTRRTILVIDNEEADRQLLADMLVPLGFAIETAASGEEGLERAATLKPDAVFVDLAMPGIDGWETIRRLRAGGDEHLAGVPVAIVSANAFDQGLPNDVGLPPADFLVKPVRLPMLLDWLGGRLALQWLPHEACVAAKPAPEPEVWPPRERLAALQGMVQLGYLRGITDQLDAIAAAEPACATWVARLKSLAREFQLDAMNRILTEALDEQPRA
jgi:signal transduction histidine kinase